MSNTLNISVTPGEGWKSVATEIDGFFTGTSSCEYCIHSSQPADSFIGHRLSSFEPKRFGLDSGESLYVRTTYNSTVVVTEDSIESYLASNDGGESAPNGLYEGRRSITAQSYVEANSKLGTQHEGSTLLSAVPALANNDTIFLTGSLPVALKGRVVSYTGSGVSTFIYEAPAYTGGTPAPYQNASAINPVAGLSQIIVGATISDDGTLVFAPEHLIGNESNQGKGVTGTVVGREKLLKPNTAYLLRLSSLDSQPQDITSLLTWYEGELDLPRP